MKRVLKTLDETFALEKPMSIDLLLKALIEPDNKLDRWITMSTMKEEGKAYFIDNETMFRTIGVIHLLSSMDLEKIQLSGSTISALNYSIHNFRDSIKKIRDASANKPIGDIMTFGDLERFEQFIARLENMNASLRSTELIAEPISSARVEEFREMIAAQWRKSRTLSKVLEFFGAEIIVADPDDKLQWVGMHRIRFKGAKIMFVEKNYQKIYNIEWGHIVSDEVTKFFLSRIGEYKEKKVLNCETYLEAFDKIINTNSLINVAFISLAATYQAYRPLTESGNFTNYTESSLSGLPFPTMGIYKERLMIIPLRNKTMGDYVIGMQLPGSIVLKRKISDTWIEGKLQIDVIEINDRNVQEVVKASNPNSDLSNPEILEEAKTGILIEIDELLDFDVPEKSTIIVVNVKERAD